jgi:hypothetical protein
LSLIQAETVSISAADKSPAINRGAGPTVTVVDRDMPTASVVDLDTHIPIGKPVSAGERFGAKGSSCSGQGAKSLASSWVKAATAHLNDVTTARMCLLVILLFTSGTAAYDRRTMRIARRYRTPRLSGSSLITLGALRWGLGGAILGGAILLSRCDWLRWL